MLITFKNKRIEKIITDLRIMRKYYPNEFETIKIRIVELKNAENLSEISNFPPQRRHKLVGEYQGCFAVDLSKKLRLVFKPVINCDVLSEIKEIMIIDIIDYH